MTQTKTEEEKITKKIFIAEAKVNKALQILNECYKREKEEVSYSYFIDYSIALNSLETALKKIYILHPVNKKRTSLF